VHEELQEFKEELAQPNNKEKTEQEYGDLLFSLVNLGRKSGLNPDDALEYTNQKFIKRFTFIEERAKSLGKNLKDMSLEEMDAIWNEAKTK
jgi:XTP/dITP diphosphohydrolase